MENIMIISPDQIRAARGLLNWTQKDLGERAGVVPEVVSRIESSTVAGTHQTREKIFAAFDKAGIEFLDHNGVRMKPTNIQILDNFMDVLDDIRETMPDGGLVIMHCADDRRSTAEVTKRLKEMDKSNYDLRFTCCEGNDFITTNPENYRWIKEDYFSSAEVQVIYDGSFVLHMEDEKDTFLLVRNKHLSEAMKKQFEYWWKKGKTYGEQ